MKAARSWRRKGTSGRPDRLAPRCSKVRACLPPRNNNRVARLATTSSTTANKANSRLVAAKRLYRTLTISLRQVSEACGYECSF